MIQAVIIEDEKKSRELLISSLSTYCSDVKVVGIADSAKNGIRQIEKNSPDLVFLDIQMKDGSGFDVLNYFEKPEFIVVFVTGYDNYAIKAIKHHAYDYLMKPIETTELQNLVRKIISNEKFNKLNDPAKAYGNGRLIIPSTEAFDFIETGKIIHIQATGSYSYIYSTDGNKYTVSKPIGYFEGVLDKKIFFRVHHSHLINISHVTKLIRGRQGTLIMSDGSKIDVAVRKRDDFLALFVKNNQRAVAKY